MNSATAIIDSSDLISYDNLDPRYNLNIEDSDEYTKNIYPLHFSKKCHDSKDFENLVKYDFPLVSRCWGERYENCAVMKKYGETCNSNDTSSQPIIETGACSCARCAMNLYGPIEDTLGYSRIDLTHDSNEISHKERLNKSDFKEQNRSSIYDKSRILKSDGLKINYKKPDMKVCGSKLSVNKPGNGLEYNYELEDKYENLHPEILSDQTIEPFVDTVGSGLDTFFESCLGICLPNDMAKNWGYSTLCCVILGIFIICLVSNAFIPIPRAVMKPPIPSYLCLFGFVILCIFGSSTFSFFQDQTNLPSFMRRNC